MDQSYTLIEYMPTHFRASHEAARNCGAWPLNGAVRVYVEGDVPSRDLDAWATVIEDGIRTLPEGETAHDCLPEDAMAPCHDDGAACAADRAYDQAKDDALTGDRFQ